MIDRPVTQAASVMPSIDDATQSGARFFLPSNSGNNSFQFGDNYACPTDVVTPEVAKKLELLEKRFLAPPNFNVTNTAKDRTAATDVHSSLTNTLLLQQSGSQHSFSFYSAANGNDNSDSDRRSSSNQRNLSLQESDSATELCKHYSNDAKNSSDVNSHGNRNDDKLSPSARPNNHVPSPQPLPNLSSHDGFSRASVTEGTNLSPFTGGGSVSSNQTLITAHVRPHANGSSNSSESGGRGPRKLMIAKNPPPVDGERTTNSDSNGSSLVADEPGFVKKATSKASVARSTHESGSVASLGNKRKSTPVRRSAPSVMEGREGSLSSGGNSKRGKRHPAALESEPSQQEEQLVPMQQSSPQTVLTSSPSSAVAISTSCNPSNTPGRTTSSSSKKVGPPPTENNFITNYFAANGIVSRGSQSDSGNNETPNASVALLQSPPSPTSSASYSSSQEIIERLKLQVQSLERQLQDREAQLKAVTNNQTIAHSTLKAALVRQEKEMEAMKQDYHRRSVLATETIERLVRSENARESNELRQRLASDGARLGKIVYTRAGMHTVESWEDGYAAALLKKKKKELKTRKEELNRRKLAAEKAVKTIPRPSELLDDSNSNNNNKVKNNSKMQIDLVEEQDDELDVMEAQESVTLHLATLAIEELDLEKSEKSLGVEKRAHLRSLKRVASEDASRFKNRPKLHERYVPLTQLGRGGFSEVWRAFDLVELREVAVKIHQLDPRWSESKKENYTKHVSREYEIHRDVRHPRIVSLYDVFEIDSDSFATILECCDGTDLDALLKEKKCLSERDARAILLQILSGMRYLSTPSVDGTRKGIIHYDLKPGNILLDEYGDAKITDFGLSKIVDGVDPAHSMELTSQGAGTLWYLPPECFMFHESVRISNKVDVWSIGIIFYQMLFGKLPFGDGQSQDKILSNHVMLNAREVNFPEKPEVSEECKEFIQQCLTYDQALRPSISQLCTNPYVRKKLQ